VSYQTRRRVWGAIGLLVTIPFLPVVLLALLGIALETLGVAVAGVGDRLGRAAGWLAVPYHWISYRLERALRVDAAHRPKGRVVTKKRGGLKGV